MDEIHRVYGPAWITAPILAIGAFIIVLVLWQPLVETAIFDSKSGSFRLQRGNGFGLMLVDVHHSLASISRVEAYELHRASRRVLGSVPTKAQVLRVQLRMADTVVRSIQATRETASVAAAAASGGAVGPYGELEPAELSAKAAQACASSELELAFGQPSTDRAQTDHLVGRMQRFLCDHDTGNREGGAGDSPGESPAASGSRAATCCVCLTAPAATVLLPCGHVNVCYQCGDQLTQCPTCRIRIEAIHHVYL